MFAKQLIDKADQLHIQVKDIYDEKQDGCDSAYCQYLFQDASVAF